MKKPNLSVSLTQKELVGGWVYLAFEMLFLPALLTVLNRHLVHPMSNAELNFAYFGLNFLASLWIFHNFLGRNAAQMRKHPAYFFQAVILGLAAYYACTYAVNYFITLIAPGFANANDASISAMLGSSRFLMTVGTVVLVPLAEECLFRGLIFRGIYGSSRWAAYLVSIAVFAAVHILGFITVYSPLELLLSFLQYLPAGLCLAWAYTKADTIFAPILMHTVINAVAIIALR